MLFSVFRRCSNSISSQKGHSKAIRATIRSFISGDPNYYINLEAQYGAINYKPYRVVLTRGENCHVWDINNKRYIDFVAAYATLSQGHCHPRIRAAAIEQMNRITLSSRVFYNIYLADYQKMMCNLLNFERFFMSNGGCEAAESSWKMARAWGYLHKKIPRNEAIIVFPEGNYTGRSIGSVSASTDPSCYTNYGPYVPNFINVPYNNPVALEATFARFPNIVAYYMENIQGEAGIIIPTDGYLKKVRALCSKYNILMICDDVQMGLGRTGHLLSADAEGVRPDIVVLGKAMSGGFMPISAVGGRSDVVLSLKTGTHGSTFCSNPMACTISHAAIDVIRDENLVENSRIKGEYMLVLLKQVANKFPRIIKEVRGRGLAIGVDIHPIHNIETIVESIIARGLLIKSSHGRTLRITPPLTLTNEIVEAGVAALSDGLSDYMQHC